MNTNTLAPPMAGAAATSGAAAFDQAAEAAYRRDVRATAYLDDPRRKYSILALALSALPGLGQVYVGYYRQGMINALVVGSALTVAIRGWLRELEPLLVMFCVFFWLYNMIDAGQRAALYNQSLMGLRPMELPEDQKTPEWRGSLAGGAALVAVGLVLFFHTMFGVPLEWLKQWWPMGFVGVGIWLIYAAVQSRQADAKTGGPARAADGEPS